MKKVGFSARLVLCLTLAVLAFCTAVLAGEAPQRGGRLVIAMEAEPPNLDMHWSAMNFIRYIAYHINEQLFTQDKSFRPIPMLAQNYSLSPDEKVYTIHLRRGVKFHNGQELAAEDAVASVERWLERSSTAQSIKFNIESIAAKDRYTLQIALKRPMGFLSAAVADFRGNQRGRDDLAVHNDGHATTDISAGERRKRIGAFHAEMSKDRRAARDGIDLHFGPTDIAPGEIGA